MGPVTALTAAAPSTTTTTRTSSTPPWHCCQPTGDIHQSIKQVHPTSHLQIHDLIETHQHMALDCPSCTTVPCVQSPQFSFKCPLLS